MSSPDVPAADEVVRVTGAWYDEQGAAYASRTADYGMYPGLVTEIGRFVASLTDIGGLVLDLGCGVGRDSQFMANRGLQVVAADVSDVMVSMAADRCRRLRAHCVRLDMRRLPFTDGVFAGAWACASLVHLPRSAMRASLTELCRVLRPGASVAISMRSGRTSGWLPSGRSPGLRWFTLVDAEAFSTMLDAHGFVHIAVESSGRDDWYVARAVRASSTDPD
jgi:SAM-dependent methyltransferase